MLRETIKYPIDTDLEKRTVIIRRPQEDLVIDAFPARWSRLYLAEKVLGPELYDRIRLEGIPGLPRPAPSWALCRNPHVVNRALSEALGIPTARYFRVFLAKSYEVWVDPIRQVADRYCRGYQGCYNPLLLNKAHESRALWEQAQRDGLENLVPLIIHYRSDPQQLRKRFGRAAWRQFCNNSPTRNKLLVAVARDVLPRAEQYLEIPSTLLRKLDRIPLRSCGVEAACWAARILKERRRLCAAGTAEIRHLALLFVDTQRLMQPYEGAKVNPGWSFRRMLEEHDRYTAFHNAGERARVDPTPYPWTEQFPVKELRNGQCTARLLCSARELFDEGQAQHHCVGSYGDEARQGTSLIYSLTSPDFRSTLELRVTKRPSGDWGREAHFRAFAHEGARATQSSTKGPIVRKAQHRGPYNCQVHDPHHLDLALLVEDILYRTLYRPLRQDPIELLQRNPHAEGSLLLRAPVEPVQHVPGGPGRQDVGGPRLRGLQP